MYKFADDERGGDRRASEILSGWIKELSKKLEGKAKKVPCPESVYCLIKDQLITAQSSIVQGNVDNKVGTDFGSVAGNINSSVKDDGAAQRRDYSMSSVHLLRRLELTHLVTITDFSQEKRRMTSGEAKGYQGTTRIRMRMTHLIRAVNRDDF
jgi:hypothetical protein